MLIKMFFISPLFIISSFAFSRGSIDFRYMGYVFKIPDKPAIIASEGRKDNFVNFQYGKAGSNKFLSFINVDSEPLIQELDKRTDCDYQVFLNDVFNQNKNSSCDEKELSTFYNVMLHDTDYGEWSASGIDVYYIIGEKKSFLILTGEDKRNINIDTGFLSKKQLKKVVSHYVQ